jgi:copper chaperone CopZ
VRAALSSLPWVKKVDVKFDQKKAVLTIDKDKLDESKIVQVLKDKGYGGKVVKWK